MKDKNRLYGDLYIRFQKKIMDNNLKIIIATLIVEIMFYIIYRFLLVRPLDILQYTLMYIATPTFINLIIWTVGRYIINNKNGKLLSETYDAIPLYILELIIITLIIVHNAFPVLYVLMACPILISVVYGNQKINKQLFVICQTEIIAIIASALIDKKNLPDNYAACMSISYVVVIFAYIYAKHIILYEKEKENKLIISENENAVLSKEVSMDGLTKLDNYKSLLKTTQKWLLNKENVIFCIIDIDNFKSVNDTYGHEFGNEVLIALSDELKKINEKNIFVSRYGGEEFGILFANMEYDEAYEIIDTVREKFGSHSYLQTDQVFTFSGGITEGCKQDTAHQLFDAADKNLYKAKKTGKNKIM